MRCTIRRFSSSYATISYGSGVDLHRVTLFLPFQKAQSGILLMESMTQTPD